MIRPNKKNVTKRISADEARKKVMQSKRLTAQRIEKDVYESIEKSAEMNGTSIAVFSELSDKFKKELIEKGFEVYSVGFENKTIISWKEKQDGRKR